MAKTVASKELTEVSEAQIAVHWKEEDYYQPSEKFKAQANMRDTHILEKFGLAKFPDCFKEYADMLTWFEPYHTVLDTSDAPFWKWFVGGKINACYNCVDRHLAKYGNKAAFLFVPEPEAEPDVVIKYQELYDRVNELAIVQLLILDHHIRLCFRLGHEKEGCFVPVLGQMAIHAVIAGVDLAPDEPFPERRVA